MHPFFIQKIMDIRKRPKTHLIKEDFDELEYIFNNNEAKDFLRVSERPRNNQDYTPTNVGKMMPVIMYPDLKQWYKERMGVKDGFYGGQIAYLETPLPPHADVLWHIEDHFTKRMPSIARYILLETDAEDTCSTFTFNQFAIPEKYNGFEFDSVVDETTITGFEDKPIGHPDGLEHLKAHVAGLGLSVQQDIKTEIGKIYTWPCNQIHSGESFVRNKATYKKHMTIFTPIEHYQEWLEW